MDATACHVSRPREDTARGEWRDGEERRTLPTLAFAPETFCPIPSSSPPATISHRLLRSSSASVPVVYSISGRPSPFSTFPPPLSRALSLPPPIVLTGHRSHPFPDIFNRLLLSSGSPIVFSVHHPPPLPLLSQRLLHSRSDLPIILSSPRQSSPASVPALSLSSSPLPTTVLDSDAIFSIPDCHHHFPHHTLPSSVSVPARAATLALSRHLLPTSDYKSPKVPIPGCCSPNDSVIPFFMSFQPTTPTLNPAPTQ
ncbi:hypothetical protein ACLOJK_007574 [Asimina triloba]